jgi:thymidine kinase
MLGETEEYEPLSRAAYFNAIRQNMIVKDPEHLSDDPSANELAKQK